MMSKLVVRWSGRIWALEAPHFSCWWPREKAIVEWSAWRAKLESQNPEPLQPAADMTEHAAGPTISFLRHCWVEHRKREREGASRSHKLPARKSDMSALEQTCCFPRTCEERSWLPLGVWLMSLVLYPLHRPPSPAA